MNTQNKNNGKIFTILTWLVVCIGVIAAISILVSKRTDSEDIEPVVEEVVATTTNVALDPRTPYRTSALPQSGDSPDELSVVDQSAGSSVVLAYATLSAPGWVAVHEIAYDGSLGPILGASRFDAGTWQGNVVLLRGTVPKMQYRAVIYHDDGDKEFDFKRDTIVMRDGAPVMTSFRTQ